MNLRISSIDPPVVRVTTPLRQVVEVSTVSRSTVHVYNLPTQTIDVLVPASSALSVIGLPGHPGPPGPAGPPGPEGPPGGGYFHYVQASPSTVWTILHTLGYYPNVAVVDSAYQSIIPEISYPDASQVVLTFSASVAGEAYLT